MTDSSLSPTIEINYTKMVKMESAAVPEMQIATVFALTIEQLSEAKLTPEYLIAKAEVANDDWEKYDNIDTGWDIAESTGLNNAVKYAEHANDPEFSLKLAVVANKARRNGRAGNKPIIPQHGMTAVITLSPTFVTTLEQNFTIQRQEDIVDATPKKQINMLTPKGVQQLLTPKPKQDAIDAMFVDMPELVPAGV